MALQRVCTRHGKIGCTCGRKVPWAGSTRRQRLPRNWHIIRKRILRRDPYCRDGRVCNGTALSTQVDHIERGDDHSEGNLRGVCDGCHRAKSSAEGNAAKHTPGG